MRKLLGIFMILSVLFGFAACNGRTDAGNGIVIDNGNVVDNNGGSVGNHGGTVDNNGSNVDNGTSGDEGETPTPPVTATSDILIAYFSCTNTTEAIARHVQAKTEGTLYEIVPEIPYTEDDLKYYTNCRADKEQADSTARPKINGTVANMEKYDIIYLGYPIWHGQAPKIIYTFLESYDFSGKTIVPFCTSHSSGIGNSDTNLHDLAPSAKWVPGKRFSSGTSQKTVGEWIESLNLPPETERPERQEITNMYLTVNGNKLEVTLAKNSATDALVELLKQGDIIYTANDYGGFEKVGSLGHTLPTSNAQITTQPGDVMLYNANQIVVFYGSNSWSYTKLGKINGYSAAELRALLGNGSVQVKISLT